MLLVALGLGTSLLVGTRGIARYQAQAASAWPDLVLTRVASGFTQPVHITHAGDGSGRLFVVERAGRIRIIKNGVILSPPFLDITGRVLSAFGEQGLLSVAFPPGYATKRYFYVNYTRPTPGETDDPPTGETVIARYRLKPGKDDEADPDSEEVLLVIDQPFINHNGGLLAFDPNDGYLYIGVGDGGGPVDPNNYAQTVSPQPGRKELLGKLLRIDVESGTRPYAIPATNPVLGGSRSEIWALGLRNPWRFAFDRQNGDLYIADVGEISREEVNYPAGRQCRGPKLRLADLGGYPLHRP